VAADIVIKTQNLPAATVGETYEAGIAYSGNAAALSGFSVTSGSLPPGLAVSSATDPRILGTPTTSGTYTFKVSLTDANGTTQSPTLTIVASLAKGGTDGSSDPCSIPVTAQISRAWPIS
jgi:large repetitive protein